MKVCVISLVGDFEFPSSMNEEFTKNLEQFVRGVFSRTNWEVTMVSMVDK